MEKLLLETFEGLSLTDRQRKVFSKVYVNRVIISRQAGTVTVYLESDHIIPFREIGLLEYALKQEFARTKYSVSVREHFTLWEGYTPGDFWREYSESILLLLKEKNVLLFNMVYRGEVSLEGNLMHIACEDDMLFRGREQELKECIQDIFSEKADISIEIDVAFSLESQSGEPEGYEVFRKNEQGFYISTRVKNLYEKFWGQGSTEGEARPGIEGAGGFGGVSAPEGQQKGSMPEMDFVPAGENGAMMGFSVPEGENGAMMGFSVPGGREWSHDGLFGAGGREWSYDGLYRVPGGECFLGF